jgi:uncharacterized membrane protein YgcG
MTKTTFIGRARLSLLVCLAGLLCLTVPKVRAGQSDQPGQAAPPDQQQAAPADQPGADFSTEDSTDKNDPPTRVARISYADGSVSLQAGGQGDWGAAARNRPVTVGDKIWTDKDSRAELQTGVMSIHLGSMTALSFLNLDQNITQIRLPEGSINFRVKEIREGDTFEIDTPNLAFVVKQAGAFRVDVNENGDSTGITTIRGDGEVTANSQTYDIPAGQRGVFNGTDTNIQAQVVQAPEGDGLDQWANDRDLREQNSVSQRYVPQDMPGTEDLDNNGTWSEAPDVGHVWYPNDVPPDWAPYSNGYWGYVGPWGWTWVDYAPWGFAPFHYGRWGMWGGRWGWCPGPVFGPAVYGPAFVGFLGGGFHFGFGVGIGVGVGWFPLGWGEPFHPWYHYGPHYGEFVNVHNTFIRNVNVIHERNFNYGYAHNVRAVTATTRAGFTGGQAVNRGAAHITEASLRGATVTNRVNASPTRQSSFGAENARGNVARPSNAVQNRSVMARTTPKNVESNMHARTMNTQNLRPGNFSNSNSSGARGNVNANTARNNSPNTRNWSAQGNTTDRGRAPQGFGQNAAGNRSTYASTNRGDRPPWAGAGSNNNAARGGNQSYSNNSRSYQPPQRNNAPSYNNSRTNSRTYAPQNNNRTYTPQNNSRTYAPQNQRSYSAPSRTYSAPSRSYGGGGSRPSGGGGAPRGGGGGSRGGGGGGHPHH